MIIGIIVAGRSGAALAAKLVTSWQEVDAFAGDGRGSGQVFGTTPLLGLIISMPLLILGGFYGNFRWGGV